MREIIKPALVLLAICVAMAAVLAFVFDATKPVIAARAAADQKAAMAAVLPQATSFVDLYNSDDPAKSTLPALLDTLNKLPVNQEKALKFSDVEIGKDQSGATVGVVCTSLSQGYSPSGVVVIVGISTTGTLTGVRIGDQNETPGLGSKVLDLNGEFMKQLNGTNLTPKETSGGTFVQLVKNKPAGAPPEQIDAVTGATFSSRAVTRGVEAAFETAHAILSAGGQL
jgi:electron transport complex protein RnfG